eukprot:ANDGO_04411.mRNA.1 hypothetical protein
MLGGRGWACGRSYLWKFLVGFALISAAMMFWGRSPAVVQEVERLFVPSKAVPFFQICDRSEFCSGRGHCQVTLTCNCVCLCDVGYIGYDCFLEEEMFTSVVSKSVIPIVNDKDVLLSVSTCGMDMNPLTRNVYASLRDVGFDVRYFLLIIASDVSCTVENKDILNSWVGPFAGSRFWKEIESTRPFTAPQRLKDRRVLAHFCRIVIQRTIYIYEILRLGYSVLHSDTDVAWYKPVGTGMRKDVDISTSTSAWTNREDFFWRTPETAQWNGGLQYYKSTPQAIEFLARSIDEVLHANWQDQNDWVIDQWGMHKVYEQRVVSGLKVQVLGLDEYTHMNYLASRYGGWIVPHSIVHAHAVGTHPSPNHLRKIFHLRHARGFDMHDPEYYNVKILTYDSKAATLELAIAELDCARKTATALNRMLVLPIWPCSWHVMYRKPKAGVWAESCMIGMMLDVTRLDASFPLERSFREHGFDRNSRWTDPFPPKKRSVVHFSQLQRPESVSDSFIEFDELHVEDEISCPDHVVQPSTYVIDMELWRY